MKDVVTMDNIVHVTLENFSEFKDQPEFDEKNLESPYIFFGDFMRFSIRRVLKEGNKECAQKIINFVNSVFSASNTDPKVKNLLAVEIFENFASYPITREMLSTMLNAPAMAAFNLTKKYIT